MNGINTYHRIEQIILSYFVNPVKFKTHTKRYRAIIFLIYTLLNDFLCDLCALSGYEFWVVAFGHAMCIRG